MITLETVMAAVPAEPYDEKRSRVGFTKSVPGWTTTGYVAVRFVDYPEGICAEWTPEVAPKLETSLSRYVKAWTEDTGNRIPVKEDDALWIPPVAAIPDVGSEKCSSCLGAGEHECNCGDLHDCNECSGEGTVVEKRGRPEQIGQAVFRSDDGTPTCIQGKFAGLLRGYSVFRYTGTPATPLSEPELLGVDDKGDVVVVVMPLRGDPRTPEVAK